MKIKNTFKRIIALTVSLLIVISATSGAIYTFAAVNSSDYTIDTGELNDSDVEAMGDTIISSVEIENTLDGGVTYTKQTLNVDNLIDKKVTTQFELKDNNPVKEGNMFKGYFHDYVTKDDQNQSISKLPSSLKAKYIDGTVRKVRITLALTGKANISNIVLAHAGANDSGTKPSSFAIANYAVFAASTKEELYDKTKASFYHIYDNATEKQKFQNYKFKEDALTGVRYVGIEIYNPQLDWSDSLIRSFGVTAFYPRIRMFNVYGTVSAENVTYDEGALLTATEKGDLELISSLISAKSYRNGVQRGSGKNCANLLDEDLNTKVEFMEASGDWAFYDKGGVKFKEGGQDVDVTANFTIALKPDSKVKKLVFVNASDTKANRTKEYEIYAADTEEDLYKFENRIEYILNSDSNKRQIINIADPYGLSAKYIGFRIIDPLDKAKFGLFNASGQNYAVPRIAQLGVYGTSIDHSPTEGASLPVPSGESVVESVYSYYYNGEERNPIVLNNTQRLYDKDLSNGTSEGNYKGSPFAYKDGDTTKYYTDRYVDIVLNLQGKTELSDVYIAHHKNTALMTREYELYIGNDKETLFEGDAYYSCDNNDLKQIQHYAFNGTTAKFVGIRIKKACGTTGLAATASNCYVRILEFNVFGNVLPEEWEYEKVSYLESHKLPNGLSLDGLTFLNHKETTLLPKSSWADEGNDAANGNMLNTENIADGDFSTQTMLGTRFAIFDKEKEKLVDYTKGRVRYQTIWYDLKSAADLSFINVAFPSNNPIWAAGEYDVFIGNDKATLFEGTPYATVDNYNLRKEKGINTMMNVIAFDKSDDIPEVARYVGIKIYNPINVDVGSTGLVTPSPGKDSNVYGRIQELQIYGNYVDKDFDPTESDIIKTADFGDLSKLEKYGKNLLLAKNSKATISGGKDPQVGHQTNVNKVLNRSGAALNDKHIDFSDVKADSDYVIYIRLTEWDLTQINGFAYQGITSGNQAYFASDYEVYVLEEKEDLATSKPVFHYNTDDYPLCSGQIIEFPKGKEPQGNWLAFKMNNPTYAATTSAYMRMAVLYAWGEEAIVEGVPANIAENMPCDVNFLNGNKRTEVTEKNLTPKELGNITDSITHIGEDDKKSYETNLKTYGTIDTSGKNRDTLEMVYNLCSDCEIDKIMVSALINEKSGFKAMKVYTSTLLQGVYDENSLIWTYKVSTNGVINPTKTFKKAQEMRYVRIVFEGTKDEVVLYTVDVIGMDNQKMKTRSLTTSMTYEDLSVERINLKTDERSLYSNTSRTLLENSINGSVLDFLAFEEGEVGKDGYSLTLNLGDLKTLSKIELKFNYGYNKYWPKKIKVYVIENSLQLTAKTTPVATVYPQKDGKTSQEITMRPKLARYIKIDFLEFAKLDYFKTPEGTYKITSSIAEIKLAGTKVKGMQRDAIDERLISFVDKKTKAEISLVKLDENDIFTNAVSARLVPEKVTNRQMDSLMINSYKVVDKTIYKVEFLDLYGKVIEDIGGREIQVRFPIKNSEKTKMLIGDASDKTKIDGLDSFEVGNWICANISKKVEGDTKVALLKLTSASDSYWSEIGELEALEEDDNVDIEDEYRDESWYESIHTTDGRFVVTPLYDVFETGLRFTATDVTIKNAYSDYYNVLDMAYTADEFATDLQVAVFYDMRLSRNGLDVELADGAFADIAYTVPAFVSNNYTDLRAFYIADTGEVTLLWSEEFDGTLTFQLEKMGKVAVVGTKIGDVDASELIDMNASSPETGESRTVIPAIISLMVAAAFVATIASKRNNAVNNCSNEVN